MSGGTNRASAGQGGDGDPWPDVEEVAARLGVKPETVYAYASRGQLRTRRSPDGRRSRYDPVDVERLRRRGGARRDDDPSLVLRTAITHHGASSLAYRGHDIAELVAGASYEQVAELLWTGLLPATRPAWPRDDGAIRRARAAGAALPDGVGPTARLRAGLALLATTEPVAVGTDPEVVAAVGRRLLPVAVATLEPGVGAGARPRPHGVGGPPDPPGIGERLARTLAGDAAPPDGLSRVLDASLVLLADHGLAASTTAVRVAAAARVEPLDAVLAGVAVFAGARHGGLTDRLQEALARAMDASNPVATVATGVRTTGGPAGFGMAQYPDGDPRARLLLEILADAAGRHPETRRRHEVVAAVVDAFAARGVAPPNVDFALGAVAAVFDLDAGAGEAVFLLARLAGWLAHAGEQYAEDDMIRPRGVYVGPDPS